MNRHASNPGKGCKQKLSMFVRIQKLRANYGRSSSNSKNVTESLMCIQKCMVKTTNNTTLLLEKMQNDNLMEKTI